MSSKEPKYSIGDSVKIVSTGKIATINKIIEGQNSFSYRVVLDGKFRTISERFLEISEDPLEDLIRKFNKGQFGSFQEFILFQTWFRLSKPIESNLYSYLGSKTVFNPHQFKPLFRFLTIGSHERLYIADEVGVGKTIESGIILLELLSRERLNNRTPILIVCPNSLGPKWVIELKERFNLNFHLHDGKSLQYTLEATLRDGIFPPRYSFAIVSLQLLRSDNYLQLIEKISDKRDFPIFGMIIIDEAHHMRNTGTNSNKLGHLLSSMTEMMLMLSATPLNLVTDDLFHQMQILNPVEFPDRTIFNVLQKPIIQINRLRKLLRRNDEESFHKIRTILQNLKSKSFSVHPGITELNNRIENQIPLSPLEIAKFEKLLVSLSPFFHSFTRTKKREAFEHQIKRLASEIAITLSSEELNFSNQLIETLKKYYIEKGVENQAIGLVINTHRRMVSSCIPATLKYLEWCIHDEKLLMDDKFVLDEVDDDSELKSESIDPKLVYELQHLVKEGQKLIDLDTKYTQFRNYLQKLLTPVETSQVIVFSFFVRTLEYLRYRLENDGFKVDIIHGKVPLVNKKEVKGRYEIIDSFKKKEFDVLLSSEVGGEGLDFQFCHAIVNYDLPYNPMRVEQRIGRVDRFGQKANKIIVANLFIKKTVDEEIYERLYRRIRLIEDGVGALEPILGKRIADLRNALISGSLTKEQKEEISQRIEEAVASAKLEMEEFEKYRRELMSDDYLDRPLNQLGKSNFISPSDAIQLTETSVESWNACSFKKKNEWGGDLILSSEVITKIEDFLKKPGNERGSMELEPLLTPRKKVQVIFNGSMAHLHPTHTFLSPTGFWTRFLISQLSQEKKLKRIFTFRANSQELKIPPGDYIVFLLELKMEGLRTEIQYYGIPINMKTETIEHVDFEEFPRQILETNGQDIGISPQKLDIESFILITQDHVDSIIQNQLKSISEDHTYRIQSRISALQKSSLIKINNLKQQMQNHISTRTSEGKKPDEKYLRLTESTIISEQKKLESKIEKLREKQEFSFDYNLEGLLYLQVWSE